jgi:hypothetical protein
MKPRHAAALALVGWYLMMPPVDVQGERASIPFAQWTKVGIFNSAAVCKSEMEKQRASAQDTLDKKFHAWLGTQSTTDETMGKIGKFAATHYKENGDILARTHITCISSGDPRLKEK